MPTNIESTNTADASLSLVRALIAESDHTEIARIRSNIGEEFQAGITIVKNHHELLEKIAQERPQLVLLGRIDKFNYFEVCQECHKIQPELPIVLLSKQKIINESFREFVKSSCGVTDVVSEHSGNLEQLFQALVSTNKSTDGGTANEPINHPADRFSRIKSLEQPIDKPIDLPTAENKLLAQPTNSGRNVLAALEEIVAISNNFFGPLAQGNYWRKAHDRIKDKFPFIQNWSADHFSKLSCHESILDRELTAADIQSLRIWVQNFIEECERIIIDFRAILKSSDLSPTAQSLLAQS
jgi:hypothetical protein